MVGEVEGNNISGAVWDELEELRSCILGFRHFVAACYFIDTDTIPQLIRTLSANEWGISQDFGLLRRVE